jgi:hypothetical protein
MIKSNTKISRCAIHNDTMRGICMALLLTLFQFPTFAQVNSTAFDIFHRHDFDRNTLGSYNATEKRADWNITYDNRPGHPEIVNFDGGIRARNFYEAGKWAHQTGSDFGGILDNVGEEVYYTYQVNFQQGFDWGRAVKFPGLQMHPTMGAGGGLNPGNGGSSIRFQSDHLGRLKWYVYHHRMSTIWGEDLGWPGFQLNTGRWHTITLRVVLNTPGQANGILQVFVDDILVNTITTMVFRTTTSTQMINRQSVSTFMGGNDSSFAPSRNQYMWMDNFFVWKYSDSFLAANGSIARGRQTHPANHRLITPLSSNSATFQINTGVSPANSGKITIKAN